MSVPIVRGESGLRFDRANETRSLNIVERVHTMEICMPYAINESRLRRLTIFYVVVILASDHKLLAAPVELFLALWLEFDA